MNATPPVLKTPVSGDAMPGALCTTEDRAKAGATNQDFAGALHDAQVKPSRKPQAKLTASGPLGSALPVAGNVPPPAAPALTSAAAVHIPATTPVPITSFSAGVATPLATPATPPPPSGARSPSPFPPSALAIAAAARGLAAAPALAAVPTPSALGASAAAPVTAPAQPGAPAANSAPDSGARADAAVQFLEAPTVPRAPAPAIASAFSASVPAASALPANAAATSAAATSAALPTSAPSATAKAVIAGVPWPAATTLPAATTMSSTGSPGRDVPRSEAPTAPGTAATPAAVATAVTPPTGDVLAGDGTAALAAAADAAPVAGSPKRPADAASPAQGAANPDGIFSLTGSADAATGPDGAATGPGGAAPAPTPATALAEAVAARVATAAVTPGAVTGKPGGSDTGSTPNVVTADGTVNSNPLNPSAAAGPDPAATPAFKLNAGVESSDFPQSLADRVSWMVGNNLDGARLQVNPPQLGPIELRISVQGDHALVWMSTHSAVTRDALESSAPKLREMLGAQGFGQVSVDISQRSFQDRSAYSEPYRFMPPAARDESPVTPPISSAAPRAASGALDAYA